MSQIALRTLAYFLAGVPAGFVAWALIYNTPFDAATQNQILVVAILVPCLVAATVLLRMAYAGRGSGSQTSPVWSILAADLTCMLAAAVAAFFAVDGFSERLGGPPADLTDPLVANVIAFLFVPTALLLALFVTQTGSQSLAADAEGLIVEGISGERHAAWTEIASFRPDTEYVPVSRLGLVVPRHLRTNLAVVLRNGETIAIFDPGTRASRKAILRTLGDSMPEAMRSGLDEMRHSWNVR